MKRKESLVSEVKPIPGNPLLKAIFHIQTRVIHLKEKVKGFYFRVLLSQYECPRCGGDLTMVGQSQCSCACGNVFDPTTAFQKSSCCDARLVRKSFHYACSRCHQTVPSRFLFDERLFDQAYFREMMRESRDRTRRKREEIKSLLAGSRSGPLLFMEEPRLESIPGLKDALDGFLGSGMIDFAGSLPKSGFSIREYRSHILAFLGVGSRLFSEITPLAENYRKDKVWRFITLIFMTQDREVELTQYGADILVERICHETHFQG